MNNINILLLSMSTFNFNLSENYYRTEDGDSIFCGVSQLETGTKYFLRTMQKKARKLDKILIVESKKVRNDRRDVSKWLSDDETVSFEGMTATEFYIERIIQYIKGKEVCRGDFAQNLQQEVMEYGERVQDMEPSLSSLYPQPESLFETLEMDENDTAVYQSVHELSEKVLSFKSNDTRVNLFTDMQGARRYETFIINSAVKTLEISDIKVQGSVAIDFEPTNTRNGIASLIVDTTANNIMFEMVSGMNEFIRTGRGDTLREFWQKYKMLPEISASCGEGGIFAKIRKISDAISLCDIARFESSLVELKEEIEKYESQNDDKKQPLIRMLLVNLKEDYFGAKHDLLPQKEMMVPVRQERSRQLTNELRWCIEKKLYQQALALIEEKVPGDIVENKILHYGEKEELKQLLNKLIAAGWKDGYPKYLLEKGRVIAGKEAFVWIRYGFRTRGKGMETEFYLNDYSSRGYDRTIACCMEKVTTKNGSAVSDRRREDRRKIAELLSRYHMLADQRNKVMHATGENWETAELKKQLEAFMNLYEELLNEVSYDYAVESPMK